MDVIIRPRSAWRSSSLTAAQLDAVITGVAPLAHVAQGVLDRRLATVAHREWQARDGAWGWRLSLTPLGVQIRRIEKARRRLSRERPLYDPTVDYEGEQTRALDGAGVT